MGKKRIACRILLGRPRYRWEDNIEMDPGEIGRGGIDWISLLQGRNQWSALVKTIMNIQVP
jgi:hypothetical protein